MIYKKYRATQEILEVRLELDTQVHSIKNEALDQDLRSTHLEYFQRNLNTSVRHLGGRVCQKKIKLKEEKLRVIKKYILG